MELKKGDKLIFPEPAEVIEVIDELVRVQFPGAAKADKITSFISSEMPTHIKVLGLLGDEGFEAEVGMEVYDATWGWGKIIRIASSSTQNYPIYVKFNSEAYQIYTKKGNLTLTASRTLYVTKKPVKLGWAWVMHEDGEPSTYGWKLPKEQAERSFGKDLIHWIPEV